ncbi:HAD family hydrolase [aff. Roholtiella sp. LEGE 12411]|uniref:HAD family hydrolase n=1 Tax=aff. Roholtiella sp. LEGE 12411 TaxID=1828822 RepID=UPI0018814944|nr:HAD family hydrolase [aff. Roholtiella sp. LEGE 12411]MBE9036161.1 HAD family hydrolase [aff. Roholtiella sp. LEGE 12411]
MSPILVAYTLKLIPNWWAKEALLTYFLSGKEETKFYQLAKQFALEKIPTLLCPEALQRLQWHQAQGHRLILVSASLEAYLLPWAEKMGFEQVAGTQLEVEDNRLTGRILGKNCYGQEKVERLRTVLGELSQYNIYAYGDSRGDQELLAVSDHPYYRNFS